MFTEILTKMILFCLLMILGFFGRRKKILSDKSSVDISTIILNLTLPCLVVMSMQRSFSTKYLYGTIITVLVSILLYLIFYILGRISAKKLGYRGLKKPIFIFSLTFTNIAFIGFPIVSSIYGPSGTFYIAIYNIIFAFMLFTLGVSIMEGRDKKNNFNIKKLINPGIIASIIGIVFFITSYKIPSSIGSILSITGEATTPLAMLAIGIMLSKTDVLNTLKDKSLYLFSLIRLIIAPIAVALILYPFIKDKVLLGVIVIVTSLPVATITAIFAERYGADDSYASEIVFVSTILSVFTLPLIILIINNFNL